MAKTPLIYDGDMGGDDLWAISALLAHQDKFRILGFATAYGNVSQPFATQNVLNHLHWLKQDSFEVAQGADTPCDGMRPFGDDAYGEDGVGGVSFPLSPHKATQQDITDWYARKLDMEERPVTIFCTGPATNTALLLEKYPDKAAMIAEFVFMGGALNPPGKDHKPVFLKDGTQRIGNITIHAEFNAYQDPKALNTILKHGVKTTIVSADATQHVVYTQDRQARIQRLGEAYGDAHHRMLMVVEHLDRLKFGVDGPFVHDPSAAAYLINPNLFVSTDVKNLSFDESSPHPMETSKRGAASLTGAFGWHAKWVNGVTDEAAVFDLIADSIEITVSRASGNQARLEV